MGVAPGPPAPLRDVYRGVFTSGLASPRVFAFVPTVWDARRRGTLVTELRSQPNWRFRELPALNHLGLFLAPDLIADALMGLAVRGG